MSETMKVQVSNIGTSGRLEVLVYNESRSVFIETSAQPQMWNKEFVETFARALGWDGDASRPFNAKGYFAGEVAANGMLNVNPKPYPESEWPDW
jgi:hypothetical protein